MNDLEEEILFQNKETELILHQNNINDSTKQV